MLPYELSQVNTSVDLRSGKSVKSTFAYNRNIKKYFSSYILSLPHRRDSVKRNNYYGRQKIILFTSYNPNTSMNFLERYKNGDTIAVYADIASLGQAAFTEPYYPDVEAVIKEAMNRSAYNLEIIYHELLSIGYNFNRQPQYSFEMPLTKPGVNTSGLISKLEKAVESIGHVPFSLRSFYEQVGACNFAWDYTTDENILWEGADPVQIAPLDDLVEQVTDEYWLDDVSDFEDTPYLKLSADYLHKDNISGGPAYGIEITPHRSIDGRFVNEEHETTFIDYLRTIFQNCGFGRIEHLGNVTSFKHFCDRVSPKLLKI